MYVCEGIRVEEKGRRKIEQETRNKKQEYNYSVESDVISAAHKRE